jgi:ATPases involved in chromosome partitioning
MSECTHDCSSCGENCPSRSEPQSFLKALNPYSSVKKVVAVVSGKGGVGKSLVTSLLASEMQRRGYRCAVLDADITGPSIPKSFGIRQHAAGTDEFLIPVTTHSGLQIMSINLILENETEPVVWRGPVIAGAVTQFWTDVLWQDVDYMFVDLPPGTGDVPLTVFQSLPIDGVVIVTTPQDLVGMIVSKAVNMAGMMNVPVLGIVENMSYFRCPDCGAEHNIFGDSKVEAVAASFGIEHFTKLPIDPAVAAKVDAGEVESVPGDKIAPMADVIEQNLKIEE